MGWCAGRNPPSVQRRHSAKRATRASRRNSQAPICPFTLQVGRFTASTRHPQRLNTLHSPLAEWTFRFCSGAKALASRLCRRCSSTWWAEFPQTHRRSKAVRQLTSLYKCRVIVTNKNYGTKKVCHVAFMLPFLRHDITGMCMLRRLRSGHQGSSL